MRIENGKRKKRKDGEKKQKSSVLELEIFRIMEQSLKAALDAAVDDLLSDWK